ncbi:MAG: hypothetical protein OEV85_04040 [Candidatus Thorarchaeota archaeon]|nr:hypothetical protein [Candidatus Thorarchaeota archaeon]
MGVQEGYRFWIINSVRQFDDLLLKWGRQLSRFLSEYRYLLAVMLIGFVVWSVVFNIALVDYLNTSFWNSRTSWLGPFPDPGEFELFGYTVLYQFEGFSDYSFYYVHWGHNLLDGVMPYSNGFGYLEMDGIVNENGAYMFPPLTAYLYAAGIALEGIIGPGNWGIGLLFSIFGYSTTLPVYGLARELSKNPRVGEIAALTYTLNPLVLYHIDYLWLNPAPFYFFFFTGFYALVKGRKHIATILIISAALFKQTAWFLGIPLVVYLLVRARERKEKDSEKNTLSSENGAIEEKSKRKSLAREFDFLFEYFDFRGFAVSIVLALSYVGAIMLPFILARLDFLRFWSLALGSFSFDGNYVDPIPYNVPIRLPVLPIMYNMPEFAEFLDMLIVSSGPFFFGIVVYAGLMLLLDKYKGEEQTYLRRILFLTMLLMLWTNLTGSRGVFKYYFTMFGPFFSIFSSARMIRGKGEHVPFSLSMIWMPVLFSLLILIPDRNFYFGYVILIFVFYSLSSLFDRLYHEIKRPFGFLKSIIGSIFHIRFGTIHYQGRLSQSLRYRILQWIIVIFSIVSGSTLIILGVSICFAWLAASLEVILLLILLMGVMIFVGVQILSIATNGILSNEEKLIDLNYVIKTLSSTIAVLILIFSIETYILSWTVTSFLVRQIMIFSSMFIIMWVLGLVTQIQKRFRLLSDCFLLIGSITATWTWFLLGDAIFLLFGCTLIAGLIILTLFTLGGNSVHQFPLDDFNGILKSPEAEQFAP